MVVSREQVRTWIDAYVAAWDSYDREAIGALFTDDVSCRYHPWDEPIVGRDAVVESWFGVGEGAPARDKEGTYDGSYEIAAIDGDRAVITGTSTYTDPPVVYENCWLVRFDEEGRCREFAEWFMVRP